MKSKLNRSPERKSVLFLVIPCLLWLAALQGRSVLIHPSCVASTPVCTDLSVPAIDRLSLGWESGAADGYSDFLQKLSGAMALAIPLLVALYLVGRGRLTRSLVFLTSIGDLSTLAQTIVWNGLFTELSHLFSQRPRPFVYLDPLVRGIDPAHYTSFYSGHTSFVAATQTALLLLFRAKKAPQTFLVLYFLLAQAMIFSTGYFRIVAGRHFLTDVLCGAMAGSLIAILISKSSTVKITANPQTKQPEEA